MPRERAARSMDVQSQIPFHRCLLSLGIVASPTRGSSAGSGGTNFLPPPHSRTSSQTPYPYDAYAPLDWSRYGPDAAEDPVVLDRCYAPITQRMQRTLDRLTRDVPYPVVERLRELLPFTTSARWTRADADAPTKRSKR